MRLHGTIAAMLIMLMSPAFAEADRSNASIDQSGDLNDGEGSWHNGERNGWGNQSYPKESVGMVKQDYREYKATGVIDGFANTYEGYATSDAYKSIENEKWGGYRSRSDNGLNLD